MLSNGLNGARLASAVVLALAAGCSYGGAKMAAYHGGYNGGTSAPPGAGATPGGAQDIGLARDKIHAGIVPNPADWTVEGILSEHDLPLEGGPCEQTLCVDAAVGLAKNLESGNREAFAQIGFSSNIDLSQFHRRPLNLAVVVDVSGSMEESGKIGAVRTALGKLIDQLNADDVLTLVSFNTQAMVLAPPAAVTNAARLHEIVEGLEAGGGTCIECGLREGYSQVITTVTPERDNRVMLFTDAQPNVGYTGQSDFITLVTSHADTVGLTAFGVGLDFGQQLAVAISNIRGGNYFFLQDAEKISTVFDEDFDLLVTPLAYDLTLTISPGPGFTVADVYGIPGWTQGDAHFNVPTVFLSKNRGAIVVRLTGTPEADHSMVSTSGDYHEVAGLVRQLDLDVLFDGTTVPQEGEVWFSKAGVRKTVALTNFALGAKKACSQWTTGQRVEARATADAVRDYLTAEANALNADDVRTEATLASELADLMGG